MLDFKVYISFEDFRLMHIFHFSAHSNLPGARQCWRDPTTRNYPITFTRLHSIARLDYPVTFGYIRLHSITRLHAITRLPDNIIVPNYPITLTRQQPD